MSLEELQNQEFVLIKGAKRQVLYGDFGMPSVRIEDKKYSEGELGIVHPEMVKQFNNRFLGDVRGLETNEINRFNRSFVRYSYDSEANEPFNWYKFSHGDLPVVLFDLEAADLKPVSVIGEKVFSNPGYFIATLNRSEIQVVPESLLHAVLTTDSLK